MIKKQAFGRNAHHLQQIIQSWFRTINNYSSTTAVHKLTRFLLESPSRALSAGGSSPSSGVMNFAADNMSMTWCKGQLTQALMICIANISSKEGISLLYVSHMVELPFEVPLL